MWDLFQLAHLLKNKKFAVKFSTLDAVIESFLYIKRLQFLVLDILPYSVLGRKKNMIWNVDRLFSLGRSMVIILPISSDPIGLSAKIKHSLSSLYIISLRDVRFLPIFVLSNKFYFFVVVVLPSIDSNSWNRLYAAFFSSVS